MISLVSKNSRWTLRDGSMVFSNMVMQCEWNENLRYHMIDDDRKELPLEGTVFDHIVDDGIPTDRE